MHYSVSDLLSQYSITKKQIDNFFKENSIKINGKGIKEKDYQLALNFFDKFRKNGDDIIYSESTINNASSEKLSFITNDNRIIIKQDDAISFLKGLENNSVDLIVTDPAYSGMNNKLMLGKGRIVGKYKDKGENGGKWFSEFQDTEENYKAFLFECKRVLKKTGHIYLMFDSFSLLSLAPLVRLVFDVKNILVWDKVNLGMGHYYRRRHEFILFATNKNNNKIKHRAFPDIWQIKRIHNAKYPTQKPVEIFDIMLSASTTPGNTVCDPFLGSGSSAISSIKYDCNFLGCDISEKSFELSKNRIEEYVKNKIDNLQKNSCIPEGIKKFW